MTVLVREVSPGSFALLSGDLRTTDGTIPRGNFDLWSDAECAAVGVYRVADPTIPPGKRLVSITYQRQSGNVVAVPTYADVFNPAAWYWVVGSDTNQVYSSASAAYVALTDAGYVTFLANNNEALTVANEAMLWDNLLAMGVAVPAGNAAAQTKMQDFEYNKVPKAVFQVLFRHENMIRELIRSVRVNAATNTAATTNGLPTNAPDVTQAQAIAAFKALL